MYPVDDGRVGHLAPGSHAARHQQCAQRRVVVEGVVGQYAHALVAAHRSGSLGNEDRAVTPVSQHGRGSEHLPRPCEVQFLGSLEDQQPARGNDNSPAVRNRFRQSDGATRAVRWNARRSVSAVPNPQRRAITSAVNRRWS